MDRWIEKKMLSYFQEMSDIPEKKAGHPLMARKKRVINGFLVVFLRCAKQSAKKVLWRSKYQLVLQAV